MQNVNTHRHGKQLMYTHGSSMLYMVMGEIELNGVLTFIVSMCIKRAIFPSTNANQWQSLYIVQEYRRLLQEALKYINLYRPRLRHMYFDIYLFITKLIMSKMALLL